ncbi:MAG TPA: flavin reductase family protein [Kutzneria sp.]|jgi:flavin reductase (DIM6/NTAB) family NADH-FMN oxidoreductase RutF|nr:flavin reductase family protein [Kutzneria sp.]
MTSFAERTLTGADFRAFMRAWPTGVAVVTSTAGPEPVGCTVNTFTSVSLCPPLLLISLARHSGTLAAITRRESFGVNVIGFADRQLATRFATGGDRFAGVSWRARLGIPVLDAAMAAVVCDVHQVVEVADHVLVIGRPRWCDRRDGGDPLVFFDADHHRLG